MHRALRARGLSVEVAVTASTTSTNDDARRAAQLGTPAPAAFFAETQTAGRGRSGARWHSPPGENLYASVLLQPTVEPAEIAPLTLAVGAELAGVLDGLAPGRVSIKWPNDLWLDGKKLAGVLVEGQIRGDRLSSVVVGVGINVATRDFPPELGAIATSLARVGVEADRNELAVELVDAVLQAEASFVAHGIAPWLERLRALDALRGRRVRVDDTEGTASGIDDVGRLLVATSGGVRAVFSGHVELLHD
jgi:BirA family biotin operon repressor/biotin-[acetyl-CoA-carboxylase] ligase